MSQRLNQSECVPTAGHDDRRNRAFKDDRAAGCRAAAARRAEERATAPPTSPWIFFPIARSLRVALEAGEIGVWSWDIVSNRVTWSSNLEAIHRLPAGSFDGTFAFFENDIHPEDRADVLAAIQEALRTGTPHRMLYRLPPRPSSEECWIEIVGTVVVEDGEPVRMVGTCRDVTERVKLHRELRMRASQQEAVARLGERALTETDLQKFFDDAVGQ